MADTKKDLSDQEKFELEHAELVEARKAAEKAVWEHRQSPTTEKLKAAAEAEADAKKAAAKK